MCGSATLTTVPSIITMAEPSTVANSTQRPETGPLRGTTQDSTRRNAPLATSSGRYCSLA